MAIACVTGGTFNFTIEGLINIVGDADGVGGGFDVDGYGDTYGSGTTVTSSAYVSTSNGLFKPNYAVVGWGGLENANLDLVETLINRIAVLEAA